MNGPGERNAGPSGADEPEENPTLAYPTEVLQPLRPPPAAQPAQPSRPEPAQAPAPERRHRVWPWLVGIPLVLIGVVVLAVFLLDGAVRGIVEDSIEQDVASRLPDAVQGEVTATVEGGPLVFQLLSGRAERIELDAPVLTVDGVPIAVHVVAQGVPFDRSAPVRELTGSITLDEEALNRFVTLPDATSSLRLGEGEFSYESELEVFGFPVGYSATAQAEAQGDTVLLTATDAEVTTGLGPIDLGGLVEQVVGEPIPVCVAQWLPEGVGVTGITVTPEHVTAELAADDIVLSERSLGTTGSC
ncbi:DUF2993 domain-containing protein [Agromyces sp. NPDC058484]|uniref:LmeA family phospholipid-binding protein n=1 Tax=Agromyces sp. NPDC058484 TaxID=3346524 RepID=UPI00365F08B5